MKKAKLTVQALAGDPWLAILALTLLGPFIALGLGVAGLIVKAKRAVV